MSGPHQICAVVPVKDTRQAKQRLARILPVARRQELALAMLEDVLVALASVRELAGIVVVTADPAAAAIAISRGARVARDGAGDGHSGAVAAAARQLTAEGFGMLTLPGDIPLVEGDDIRQLIAVHRIAAERDARAFTIAPARDERGSNAVLCSPAAAVPLRFGDDSFFPHLATARACGIAPVVVRLPRIALDIDTPEDAALFLEYSSTTRAHALLARWRIDRHPEGLRKATA
jgi:2-phospho-L-lactate/phosphoenolpyruvate guanylyltransferase